MRAVPVPNDDETGEEEDRMVADPLVEATDDLWNNTARKNREIFTEIFRPVPTNLIRSWGDYEVSVSCGRRCHSTLTHSHGWGLVALCA